MQQAPERPATKKGNIRMAHVVIRPPTAQRIDAYNVALKYASDILTGRIVAGKLIKLAAKRFISDLKVGPDRGVIFDKQAAQHVVDFFSTLHHSKGEWGPRPGCRLGDPFRLSPWQVFILANLFGFKMAATGYRRFGRVHIEVARKNGKSTFMAGIGLYMFAYDGEPGAECYAIATRKEQAREVFDEAVRMAEKSMSNKVHFSGGKVKKTNISILGTASKFELQASDYGTADGKNVHCLIADELHQHPSRLLWDAYSQAVGTRRQPLLIGITTAGFDTTGICYAQRNIGSNVLSPSSLEEVIAGDSFFAYIACIDEPDKEGKNGDDPFDERCWIKANPNLEYIAPMLADLRKEAGLAKIDASALNVFLCKKMNVWVNQEFRWMDPAKWAQCNAAGPLANPLELREAAMKRLQGRPCIGGLDLSEKFDLSAFALIFPPSKSQTERVPKPQTREQIMFRVPVVYDEIETAPADDKWSVLVWFWVPKDKIPERVKKDRVMYDVWARDGYILTCPGNVIDHEIILNHIQSLKDKFQFKDIGYDEWNAGWISKRLDESGFATSKVPMIYSRMSEPMKNLMAAVLEKKLEHYGDPVLSWNASNVSATTNANGDIRPDKDKSKEKIDGIVAIIMALSLVCSNPKLGEDRGGAWDYSKGIVFI